MLGGIAAVVLALDVTSKHVAVATLADRSPVRLVDGVLDLTLTRNGGAAFGLAGGATVLFTVIALVVVVAIVRSARRLCSLAWAGSFGLILGGALGNLGDRIFRAPGPFRGQVVDWVHLHHWPVFNLADASIVVGGILAVLLALRGLELDGTRRAR